MTTTCRLCGSESNGMPSGTEHGSDLQASATRSVDDLHCACCGAALPANHTAAAFFEKVKQLAQFGLTSNARLLSEISNPEN